MTLSPHDLAGLVGPPSTTRDSVEVLAPFTGRPLARIPQASVADVEATFAAARQAQVAWSGRPVGERVAVVQALVRLLRSERKAIVDLLQEETGKARIDAVFETGEAVLGSMYHARCAPHLLAPRRHPGAVPGLTTVTELRHPRGVVVVIAPWNFPLALAVVDAVPALLAGNSVILKPDNQTALSALLLRRLAERAGLPSDVLQIVTGDPGEIGNALIDGADYVAFTGSTSTGHRIGARAASRAIGCSLELGGKNPMIVLADADLRRAAGSLPRASFANAGQICMTIERLYVQSSVYEQFLALAHRSVVGIRMGAARNFSVDMGSLTTRPVFDRVTQHVDQARELGATVLTGGRPRPDLGPLFFEPTVLAGVPVGADIHATETFGPVVCVYPFEEVDDAVRMANDSEYGLIASVWSRDVASARGIAARIQAGAVNINDSYGASYASYSAPMGGMKGSGLGRRHGAEGLLRYTQSQVVAAQRVTSMEARLGLPRALHGRLADAGIGVMSRRRYRRR